MLESLSSPAILCLGQIPIICHTTFPFPFTFLGTSVFVGQQLNFDHNKSEIQHESASGIYFFKKSVTVTSCCNCQERINQISRLIIILYFSSIISSKTFPAVGMCFILPRPTYMFPCPIHFSHHYLLFTFQSDPTPFRSIPFYSLSISHIRNPEICHG